MKKFMALLVLVGLFGVHHAAQASGCGGPEYYLRSTRVLESAPFVDVAENYDLNLTTYLKDPSYRLEMPLFTKILAVPGNPYFFWHNATVEGSQPAQMDIKKLDQLLKGATLEIVEDTYDITCADPVSTPTAKNLRVIVKYDGQDLEIRTHYVPEARPW